MDRRFDAEVEFLLDFPGVAVHGRLETPHGPAPLRVMTSGGRFVPGGGTADFPFDHNHVRVYQAVFKERFQAQDSCRRQAPGPGSVIGFFKLVPVQFGNTVDEFRKPFFRFVLVLVPARVEFRVVQAEIGRKVDNPGRQGSKFIYPAYRRAVGEGQEQQIYRVQGANRYKFQFGAFAQVRVNRMNKLACIALAGDLDQFDVRVVEQKPHQFTAAIPAATHHAYPDFLGLG